MSNDPVQPAADAGDLLGRWFAHHDKAAEEKAASEQATGEQAEEPAPDDGGAPPRRLPLAARLSEAAAPRMTRPSAAAVLAELRAEPTVERDDDGGGAAPAASPGPRRGLPGSAHSGPTGPPQRIADGQHPELDRPSPAGFEPVILRSMRKKSEPEEPEKKGSRLSRLRSRVVGPVDEPAEEPLEGLAEGLDEEPGSIGEDPAADQPAEAAVVVPPPPVFEAPAPTTRKLQLEEVIALATAAAVPVVEPKPEVEPVLPGPDTEPAPLAPEPETEPVVPEPEPEPVVPEPEPEPVVPEPEPEPEPQPELPGPDTEPAPILPDPDSRPASVPVDQASRRMDDWLKLAAPARAEPDVPTKRRLVTRSKQRPLVARGTTSPTTGTGEAARGLLAAARAAAPPPGPAPTPAPAPAQAQAPTAAAPLAPPPRPAPAEPEPDLPVEQLDQEKPAPSVPAAQMPAIYQFAPIKTGRRFLSLMLLTGLTASGYLGYGAYQSRETIAMGVAGIVTLATLVIWAIRAGASVTRLTVRRGQLEISRQGGRLVFDLASTYTPIQVVGRPGSKKWKVLFLRRGMSPVVVDTSMVDAQDFMRVLKFFRPDIGHEAPKAPVSIQ